jgi:hypothetical protein
LGAPRVMMRGAVVRGTFRETAIGFAGATDAGGTSDLDAGCFGTEMVRGLGFSRTSGIGRGGITTHGAAVDTGFLDTGVTAVLGAPAASGFGPGGVDALGVSGTGPFGAADTGGFGVSSTGGLGRVGVVTHGAADAKGLGAEGCKISRVAETDAPGTTTDTGAFGTTDATESIVEAIVGFGAAEARVSAADKDAVSFGAPATGVFGGPSTDTFWASGGKSSRYFLRSSALPCHDCFGNRWSGFLGHGSDFGLEECASDCCRDPYGDV